jgi:endosialidase-like protein
MRSKTNGTSVITLITFALIVISADVALGQASSFTYQGRLQDAGTNANGNYDFQFTLWDALSGGTQQPQPSPVTVTRSGVAVAGGVFTVQLDFGANAFPGADRFIEISVRPASGGTFTALSPRQPITSTPYAVRSLNAASADNVTVSGVPAGSSNYIQNTTAQQPSSNFNISGNGLVGGNLGLGGASTGDRLHVAGTTYFSDKVGVGTNAGTGLFNVFDTLGGRYAASIESSASSPNGLGLRVKAGSSSSDAPFAVQNSGGSELFKVRGDGTVAIGGNIPASNSSRLAVFGGTIGVTIDSGQSSTDRPFRVRNQNGGTLLTIKGDGFTGIGTDAPLARFSVAGNAFFEGPVGINILPSSVARFQVDDINTAIYGHSNSGYGVRARSENNHALYVEGSSHFTRWVELEELIVGGGTPLCRGGINLLITNCNASSIRYKKNIRSFDGGLDIVKKLRPITFDWRTDGTNDLGLSAEDVEKVAAEFVFYDKGQLEGVRYEKLGLVLINAVKEQQAQIDQQQEQLKQQRSLIEQQAVRINKLRRLVCRRKARATICPR